MKYLLLLLIATTSCSAPIKPQEYKAPMFDTIEKQVDQLGERARSINAMTNQLARSIEFQSKANNHISKGNAHWQYGEKELAEKEWRKGMFWRKKFNKILDSVRVDK